MWIGHYVSTYARISFSPKPFGHRDKEGMALTRFPISLRALNSLHNGGSLEEAATGL